MAVFATSNSLGGTQQAISGTYKTLLALTAATATLTTAAINDVEWGTNGTPADNYMEYDISAQTGAGTSTAVTPQPTNQAWRAAGIVGSANFTAEGTITATSSRFYLPVNQRASYRLVAVPGNEIIIPATNLAGYAFRARSGGYTGTAGVQAYHVE